MSEKGFFALGGLLAGVILAILMFSFMQWVSNIHRVERGLSSNFDMEELSLTIRQFTEKREVCAQTGLVGQDVSSLLSATPPSLSVSLVLGGIPIQAGTQYRSTSRRVDSLAITRLIPVSGRDYLANIQLSTSVMGKAVTNRNPQRDFLVPVTLDAADRIESCGSQASGNYGGFVKRCLYNTVDYSYPIPNAAVAPVPHTIWDPYAPSGIMNAGMIPGGEVPNQYTGNQNCPAGHTPHYVFGWNDFQCTYLYFNQCAFWSETGARYGSPGANYPQPGPGTYPRWVGCSLMSFVCTKD